MLLGFCLKIKVTSSKKRLTVKKGLKKFDATFDLLIIDIMMPNISGIEVCRKIREKSYVPILFLTAKSLETDKNGSPFRRRGRLSCKTILLRGAYSAYSGSYQKMSRLRQCRCIRHHRFIHY